MFIRRHPLDCSLTKVMCCDSRLPSGVSSFRLACGSTWPASRLTAWVKLCMRPCGQRWAGWHGHPEVGVWICEFLWQVHGQLLDEREACWSMGGDQTASGVAPLPSNCSLQWRAELPSAISGIPSDGTATPTVAGSPRASSRIWDKFGAPF